MQERYPGGVNPQHNDFGQGGLTSPHAQTPHCYQSHSARAASPLLHSRNSLRSRQSQQGQAVGKGLPGTAEGTPQHGDALSSVQSSQRHRKTECIEFDMFLCRGLKRFTSTEQYEKPVLRKHYSRGKFPQGTQNQRSSQCPGV